ncbi:MAG: FtsW/RodA/SpoVE family cell cycle protein, partial [Burkholderiales bacterium]
PPKEGVDALPVRVHGREFARTGAAPGSIKGFDQPLIWAIAGLLLWGLVMVYSASIALNDNAPTTHVWHAQYLARHTFSVFVGFVLALLVFQVPMERWEKAAPWVFIVSIVLLIAVLLPFIGKSVNGARRWISFGGLNFQPSELAKLGTLLYAANYMVRKMDVKEKFFAAVTPMAVAVAIVGSLLLAEPDMGAFLVIAVIAMGILFLGGVNARMFILITAILLIAFALMIAASPWRRERIFAYLDPFGADHALGKGFQLSHSLIAFGRGEIFGVGLG